MWEKVIMRNQLFLAVLCTIVLMCPTFSSTILNPRTRAIKNTLQQTRRKTQVAATTKKAPLFASKTVKEDQEKRAKERAAIAASTPMLASINNISGRIEIQTKDNKETAYWINARDQKMPIGITPVGSLKMPESAFLLGSFYDSKTKTSRVAFIIR